MTWPTTTGDRTLVGPEGRPVRGSIGMMLDMLVAESRDEVEQHEYGITWFDQWDPHQRIWLLEQVTRALFTRHRIASPAAMFDAAADTIFFELQDLICIEIADPGAANGKRSWREDVVAARSQQASGPIELDPEQTDDTFWNQQVTRLADHILGVRVYQKAQSFRDREYSRTKAFLVERGLPDDYLLRIPELRRADQTQLSIDRIQNVVFPPSD